ncbi:MAG: retropepsin-like domain-containing protein [Euryarchaeota archaeon]|nr:retropepsin-like domain-containing protein [Euryarchaeota archaeon]
MPERRAFNGSFQFSRVPLPTPVNGVEVVLRPYLTVRLSYGRNEPIRFTALVDTGADFSLVSREVAEELGVVPEALAGPDYPFQGVGSRNAARSVELHLETGYKDEGLSIDMPFLVIMNDALGQTRDILLGRHPLFHSFDFGFRMGFTDDPEIGK